MAYANAPLPARPEVIGHRGSPRDHRENTLASFHRAFEVGANAVEIDVHGTADGAIVIHHDPVTNSRPGESGPRLAIAASTFASLRDVPITDGPIPRLEELIAVVPSNGTVYVEVKAKGIEQGVVSIIRASTKPCAVHSFDHRVARRVHEIAPEIPVGILQTSYPIDPIRPMRDALARDLWQHWELVDESLIERVHAAGGRLIAWTVNDVEVARRFIAWGIDGICSDVPATMRAAADQMARETAR